MAPKPEDVAAAIKRLQAEFDNPVWQERMAELLDDDAPENV